MTVEEEAAQRVRGRAERRRLGFKWIQEIPDEAVEAYLERLRRPLIDGMLEDVKGCSGRDSAAIKAQILKFSSLGRTHIDINDAASREASRALADCLAGLPVEELRLILGKPAAPEDPKKPRRSPRKPANKA